MHQRTLEAFMDRLNENGLMFGIDMACHILAEASTGLAGIHATEAAGGKALTHGNISPRAITISFEGSVALLKNDRPSPLRYSSPETREGRASDFRSDLYSLGVILWELLTANPLETAGNVAAPSKHNPEIPGALDAIALRAVARDPDARFQSAEEFRDHLHAFLRSFFPEFNPQHLALQARELFPGDTKPTENESTERTALAASGTDSSLILEKGESPRRASSGTGTGFRPDSPQLAEARKRMLQKQIAAMDQPSFSLGKTVFAFVLASGMAIAGYKWYQTRSEQVKALAAIDSLKSIADGSKTKTETSVEPAMGTVEFRHEVAIFDVFLNDEKIELTEGRFNARVGAPLRIKIKRPGYEDILIETALKSAATEIIELKFVPEAPKGFLNLETVPGTHLSFFKDGQKVFEAYGSVENKTLPAGRYKVVFENQFANHKSEQELVIEQWKTTTLKKDFTL